MPASAVQAAASYAARDSAGQVVERLNTSGILSDERPYVRPSLSTLRQYGREAAERWIGEHFDKLGRESSLDIRQRYL